MPSHEKHRSSRRTRENIAPEEKIIKGLWDSFWSQPVISCPKCGSAATEYYDPFFFALSRTLSGKRRIRCTACRFVWRPSRSGRSVWDKFKPVM
ncbi:MAG: hypothetical protein MUF22_00035 [Chitinispirillaceae bacterium]|jgi:DNA-directed RNA polymerase subunit RPC12/RpoP|nr:hypothetical protein [Chitinispirillaceae bacterium]